MSVSKTQRDTLQWYVGFILANRRTPRIKDVQEAFELSSTASAHERIQKMKDGLFECPLCGGTLVSGERSKLLEDWKEH